MKKKNIKPRKESGKNLKEIIRHENAIMKKILSRNLKTKKLLTGIKDPRNGK